MPGTLCYWDVSMERKTTNPFCPELALPVLVCCTTRIYTRNNRIFLSGKISYRVVKATRPVTYFEPRDGRLKNLFKKI